MNAVLQAFDDALTRTGSTRPLALFRIAMASLAYMRFGPELSLHLSQSAFQILISLSFFLFAGLMAIGWMTRVATAGTALILAVLYLQLGWSEVQPGWSHHHHYLLLIATVLLCLAPCGRSLSVDAWIARRAALRQDRPAPEETGPLAVQTLLIIQLCAMYVWTAVDKTTPGFLSGDRLERIFEWTYAGTPLYPVLTAPWFTAPASIAVVILEYVLPIMLVMRWRLPIAFAIGFALHAGFYVMLPVQTYSATALAFYLLVLRPEQVHDGLNQLIAPARARSV